MSVCIKQMLKLCSFVLVQMSLFLMLEISYSQFTLHWGMCFWSVKLNRGHGSWYYFSITRWLTNNNTTIPSQKLGWQQNHILIWSKIVTPHNWRQTKSRDKNKPERFGRGVEHQGGGDGGSGSHALLGTGDVGDIWDDGTDCGNRLWAGVGRLSYNQVQGLGSNSKSILSK